MQNDIPSLSAHSIFGLVATSVPRDCPDGEADLLASAVCVMTNMYNVILPRMVMNTSFILNYDPTKNARIDSDVLDLFYDVPDPCCVFDVGAAFRAPGPRIITPSQVQREMTKIILGR